MQEYPPPPMSEAQRPALSNYSNHTSSTISCHSQMGIQAVGARLSARSCEQRKTRLLLRTRSSHLLTHSSALPGMISEVWVAACAYVRVHTTPPVPALLYTFLRQGWFHCNLFVWPCCVSVRNQTRGIYHMQERKQSRSGRAVHPSGWTEQNLCAAC